MAIPSVGRIVHYHPPLSQAPSNGDSWAALIVAVYKADDEPGTSEEHFVVNLMVWHHDGKSHVECSVKFTRINEPEHWSWAPIIVASRPSAA